MQAAAPNNGHATHKQRLASLLLQCFRGREDTLAVQSGNVFLPEKLSAPLTKERFAVEHLCGDRCLGFYVIREDDHVLASAPDLDNHGGEDPEWRNKSEAVYYELTKLGLSPVVEVSQSGEGSHVWLLFGEPVPAWLVGRFWRVIESVSGVDFREINPKQDSRHSTDKGLGNHSRR